MNSSPASCAVVSIWPAPTSGVPSASVTIPLVGSACTMTTRAEAVKFGSVGAAIPIGVADAPGAATRLGCDTTGCPNAGPMESSAEPTLLFPAGSLTL